MFKFGASDRPILPMSGEGRPRSLSARLFKAAGNAMDRGELRSLVEDMPMGTVVSSTHIVVSGMFGNEVRVHIGYKNGDRISNSVNVAVPLTRRAKPTANETKASVSGHESPTLQLSLQGAIGHMTIARDILLQDASQQPMGHYNHNCPSSRAAYME